MKLSSTLRSLLHNKSNVERSCCPVIVLLYHDSVKTFKIYVYCILDPSCAPSNHISEIILLITLMTGGSPWYFMAVIW